jgi:arsenite oxidase small subunit
MNQKPTTCSALGDGMTRRSFLLHSGAATVTIMLSGIPGMAKAAQIPAWVQTYERVRLVRLSDIKRHTPIYFEYPDLSSSCFLVQMDGEAGSGVGPGKDIVAFHNNCTHMGGPLHGTYRQEYGAVGPCPFHLTSFDIRRHGMVIAGHATESLPQVVLEVESDWVYATAMMGLIYGRVANISEEGHE